MGILRVLVNAMGRVSTFRFYQFVLLLAAALAVVAFYYFGSERHDFSNTTKRIKQTQAIQNANWNDADLSLDTRLLHPEGGDGEEGESDWSPKCISYQDDHLSVVFPIVEAMQKHFSAGSGAYNNDAIFFLSVAMHHIMSTGVLAIHLQCIVQLDLDLKYRSNIRELFLEFDRFPSGAVIGIAREMQPVYRFWAENGRELFDMEKYTFWQYCKENPQSRVGEPPPDGLPGFNSGVMLLDLGAMRTSALYNQLLEPRNVSLLADQYHFRGYLGDQDFFTMIGMEHQGLFHALACGWNR